MDRDLLRLVWPVFSEEAREHLQALGDGILSLERGEAAARPDLGTGLKRIAHTLKGSASSLGIDAIERLAHELEDLLGKGGALPDGGAENALAKVSAMERALAEIDPDREEAGEHAAEVATPIAGPSVTPVPAPAPAPAALRPPGPNPADLAAARARAERAAERTVRVPVRSLDSLIGQIEEMILARGRQEKRVRVLRALLSESAEVLRDLQGVASVERLRPGGDPSPLDDAILRMRGIQRELGKIGQEAAGESERLRLVGAVVRDDFRDLRAVPSSLVLEPLHRVVRETAGRLDKEVDLVVTGGDVRLDRRVLDEIKDPLLHLVRNAVDHGIEPREARRAAGKTARGALRIAVEQAGRRIRVTVADDGGGLDLARLRDTAIRRGLLDADAALALPDDEAMRLIFRPGFSTAERVSEISGRGVGLDVVHAAVVRMQGSVDVASEPGRGTRFVLDLPLTLAAALGVLVRAGGELLAVPSDGVERVVRLRKEALGTVAGRVTATVLGAGLPFCSLAAVLGLPRGQVAGDERKPRPALVLTHGGTWIVAAVDEVLGQQELVLHPLGDALSSARHLAGAAVLEGRQLVPVLSVPEVVRVARPQGSARNAAPRRPILIVDDSLTTRAAMKAVLELAGHAVIPAADGQEALDVLDRTPCALVVSDVQMPRLDGLGLCRRIRADANLRSIPVILVTSLDGADDRAAGLEAGADGYLVKREVERGRLLELVQQLLPAGA